MRQNWGFLGKIWGDFDHYLTGGFVWIWRECGAGKFVKLLGGFGLRVL